MPDGGEEIPIGDYVQKWLNSKKDERTSSEQPNVVNEELFDDAHTEAFLNKVLDSIAAGRRAKAEGPDRRRRLYQENPNFREATDSYHDYLSILSSIPAFREGVVDAQRDYFRMWSSTSNYAYEQYSKLEAGEPVALYEMLDKVFNHGVQAQFKAGDLYYNVYASEYFIGIERSSEPISKKDSSTGYRLDFMEVEDEKLKRVAKDPTFKADIIHIRIDDGEDKPPDLSAGKPRDFLRDNRSSISYHNYRSGQKAEIWVPGIITESSSHARSVLAELQKNLKEGNYEETPTDEKKRERYGAYHMGVDRYRWNDETWSSADEVEQRRIRNTENLPRVQITRDQWRNLLSTIPEYAQAPNRRADDPNREYADDIREIHPSFRRGNNYYKMREVSGGQEILGYNLNFIRILKSSEPFVGDRWQDYVNADEALTISIDDDNRFPSLAGYYNAKQRRE